MFRFWLLLRWLGGRCVVLRLRCRLRLLGWRRGGFGLRHWWLCRSLVLGRGRGCVLLVEGGGGLGGRVGCVGCGRSGWQVRGRAFPVGGAGRLFSLGNRRTTGGDAGWCGGGGLGPLWRVGLVPGAR